jgi:predicted DNA-binding transcriptional regulator AlpA
MQTQTVSPQSLHAGAPVTAMALELVATFGRATGIFSPRHVSESLGLSLPTLWRMRQRREFPDPIQLSPGRKGYTSAMLGEWLESRSNPTDDRSARPTKPVRAKSTPKGRTRAKRPRR